ncbi:MAG: recombination protein NinB [Prevotellaceae bacterium]|jgi:hypothetical protein|nr:recombination protein NinB [Prevotellaceae bacterium]
MEILKYGDKQKVIDYVTKLPDDKQYIVKVKRKRKRKLRTIDQNRLYWACLSCIMHETGNDKDVLHEFFKQKFLGTQSRTFRLMDCEYSVAIPASTTKLNTKEMTFYLERIRQFASAELGIVLPEPEDRYLEEFYNQYKDFI